jgi:hypothetical protein
MSIDGPRMMRQMSLGTIRYIIDAIVELVTNSDDGYKRLEHDGITVKGEIKIFVRRLKGNKCDKLEVTDFAGGMDKEQLKKALVFAGKTSGFEKGKSVRGLFGRGLKESIIALGKAEIYTIKDDKLCVAEIWVDDKDRSPKYHILNEPYVPTIEERTGIGIIEGDGTRVSITVTNKQITCPDYKTLKPQIANHFALREINSSPKRKVILDFELPEKGRRHPDTPIAYEPPTGKEKYCQSIILPGYEDEVMIKLYESDERLESPYQNPCAKAGLLIKTAGAILDNQLFKYQNEEAGCFFFGEVICEGVAKRLKEEDWGVIDQNRGGIEWKHTYCESLRYEIEKVLEPYIMEKKKQFEGKSTIPPPEKTKKMLNELCSLLNRFAKDVLTDLPPDIPFGEKITELTIKPSYANLEINKERYFSIYAPLDIINSSVDNIVEIKSDNPNIQILDPNIILEPSRKYSDIYYKPFRVIGRIDGAEATITCKLDTHTATTVVRVAPPKQGKEKGKPSGPKGGFFREIKPDPRNNPAQRVRYDNGIIWVFVKFPVVSEYLDETLSPQKPEAKIMLAELVGESFCRFIAREEIDRGKRIVMTNEIDAFSLAMDDLQKKFLHRIHEIILKYHL